MKIKKKIMYKQYKIMKIIKIKIIKIKIMKII